MMSLGMDIGFYLKKGFTRRLVWDDPTDSARKPPSLCPLARERSAPVVS